jgi:CRP/FNR family transcriptional regulator
MSPTTNLYETLLQQYPDFLNLKEPSWSNILKPSQKKHIPAGTFIFRETEVCTNFMWMLEGTVRVFKHSPGGREITLYRVTPGELCVLSLQCLMGGGGFPAVAVAETDLVGLALSKTEFDNAIDESREFRRYLINFLSHRLGDVVQLVSDVTFQRLEIRLTCLLGQLFKKADGGPIQITHAKLAHELGTTREMISRILKELENKQCIQLARGEIHLVSKDVLQWFTNS